MKRPGEADDSCGLAGAAGGKAAHLQRASLDLLRRPRYAHPFYWAGFVLVGNAY